MKKHRSEETLRFAKVQLTNSPRTACSTLTRPKPFLLFLAVQTHLEVNQSGRFQDRGGNCRGERIEANAHTTPLTLPLIEHLAALTPSPRPCRLLLAVADDLASIYNAAPGGALGHRLPLERIFNKDSSGVLYEGQFMKALRSLSASSITAQSLWKVWRSHAECELSVYYNCCSPSGFCGPFSVLLDTFELPCDSSSHGSS